MEIPDQAVRALLRLIEQLPDLKRTFWGSWYDQLTNLAGKHAVFMNYGFEDGLVRPSLAAEDEDDRYCIQLYHHVASQVPLRGLDVAEVGSGRGGGASYIARYLGPRSMTGVDLSANAVEFCNSTHQATGLRYVVGDAEDLPLEDESVDVVVNVESSHCYPHFDRFLDQAFRVLRPGGHLVHTDFRTSNARVDWLSQITSSPFEEISRRDITAAVIRALELDHDRKDAILQSVSMPSWVRPHFRTFAGLKGSAVFDHFSTRNYRYITFVLRK